MKKTKEILRLKFALGLDNRQIARSLGVSHSTVGEYVKRAKACAIGWEAAKSLDDEAIERLLFGSRKDLDPDKRTPDVEYIRAELAKKGVTLMLLWEEYLKDNPEGYRYTQFCEYYRRYQKGLDVSMHQTHKAGERCFIDYAGHTMPITDRDTGEVSEAQIFVAILGASDLIFAEATPSQELRHFIDSHVRAFAFFGGVPGIIIPDNLKQAITKTCRYEPDINPTYHDLARHYGVAVIPARVARPKDKAKVENAVLQVERRVLAPLRNHTFFSLAELNEAMAPLLVKLNERPLTGLEKSRYQLFEETDKPALRPLPEHPYVFAEFKKARVNIDHHVEVQANYYSVPYQLVRKEVEARISARVIEIFHQGRRVASHMRCNGKRVYVTKDEHRPASHQRYLEWTPSRMISWAKENGEATGKLVAGIIESRPHPEQGYRSCLGIIRLGGRYGAERVEAACSRALKAGCVSYRSVRSILENGLEKMPSIEPASFMARHENVRGPLYYQGGTDA